MWRGVDKQFIKQPKKLHRCWANLVYVLGERQRGRDMLAEQLKAAEVSVEVSEPWLLLQCN